MRYRDIMRKLLLSVLFLMMPVLVWAWTTTNHFDTKTTADGWYTWTNTSGATVSITGTQSAPGSSGNSLQIMESAGFPDSGVPGGATINLPAGIREVWMQYYFKYSSNFEWHTGDNKQIYSDFSGGNGCVIETHTFNTSTMWPICRNVDGWLTSNTGNNPSISRNQWYKGVIHMKIGASAGTDVFQLWIDDVLVSDYKNATITDDHSGSSSITNIKIDPVWGGQQRFSKSVTDYQWYDYVIVSTDPIPVGSGGFAGGDAVKIPKAPNTLFIQ